MQLLLWIILALALAGDVLLGVLLAGQRRSRPDRDLDALTQALRQVMESETDLLADQLRVTQGETARATQAAVRDLGALLAENQNQSAKAATARLGAIDRAGGRPMGQDAS